MRSFSHVIAATLRSDTDRHTFSHLIVDEIALTTSSFPYLRQVQETYMSTSTPPPLETTREVRFAVVMYGGVSLAIYINGITQELFHLVRATAGRGINALLFATPADDASENPNKLSPTERVY